MNSGEMLPADRSQPDRPATDPLRHWFARHQAGAPATNAEPATPDLHANPRLGSGTARRTPARSRTLALAVCVSVAVHVVAIIIYWPFLRSLLLPQPRPSVANTEASEIQAGPSTALPSGDTKAEAVVPQADPQPQPPNPKIPETAFLHPGETVKAVYPDGLLMPYLLVGGQVRLRGYGL